MERMIGSVAYYGYKGDAHNTPRFGFLFEGQWVEWSSEIFLSFIWVFNQTISTWKTTEVGGKGGLGTAIPGWPRGQFSLILKRYEAGGAFYDGRLFNGKVSQFLPA